MYTSATGGFLNTPVTPRVRLTICRQIQTLLQLASSSVSGHKPHAALGVGREDGEEVRQGGRGVPGGRSDKLPRRTQVRCRTRGPGVAAGLPGSRAQLLLHLLHQ